MEEEHEEVLAHTRGSKNSRKRAKTTTGEKARKARQAGKMGKTKARGERNASGGQRIGKEDQFMLPNAKDVAHWHVGKGVGKGAIGRECGEVG